MDRLPYVMRTHPQLHYAGSVTTMMYGEDANTPAVLPTTSVREFIDQSVAVLQRLSDGMAGMVHRDEVAIAQELKTMALPDDIPTANMAFTKRLMEEITARGRARGLDVPDLIELAMKHKFKAVEFMFPHYFLLPTFSAMSSYRIRPLTPETCIFELWSLAFLPDDETRAPVLPRDLPYNSPEFPEIPRQDYANLPLQQLGLHAHGFEYMRLSGKIEGLISNYQRLIDGYIAGLDPQKLAKGSQIVNDGLDSPILDIGF